MEMRETGKSLKGSVENFVGFFSQKILKQVSREGSDECPERQRLVMLERDVQRGNAKS